MRTAFREWLRDNVQPLVDDEALPDMWAFAREARTLLVPTSSLNLESFADDETEEVRSALSRFGRLVEESFHPTQEEWRQVQDQLMYLTRAVDRLNKFDWKGVAVSTVTTIAAAPSLDTARGRLLIGLFQQAFQFVSHLLK